MPATGKVKRTPEVESPVDRRPVIAVLLQAVSENAVHPSELTECLYYAAEDDLLKIMRLIAALEPEQRGKVYENIKALQRRGAEPA